MDEMLVKEIIRDLERISKIVDYRLEQLYEIVGNGPIRSKKSVGVGDGIKEEKEKQRAEMMDEMEKIRRQAMIQVQSTMNKQDLNIPNFPFSNQPTMPPHILRRNKEKNYDEK